MAEGFTRPVDVQVARPVAAPNYVQMYSEAVRSALEPMQFLVNYQKELSEEDFRKAQIQNFLEDHKDKAAQLAEEARGHRATEAMTMLERQTEQARELEAERHNLTQEKHEDVTAAETLRYHKAEEDWRQKTQEETNRHNQFLEDQDKKKQELATDLNKANIESKKAETLHFQSETQKLTADNEAKQNDDQVIMDATDWIHRQNPESIYNTDEHPELTDQAHSFYDRIKTPEGRARLDEIVGGHSALGQEINDRKRLMTFSPEAKRTFQDNFLKSDPNKPTQLRFNEALEEAKRTEGMYRERTGWVDEKGTEHPGWSDQAIAAYNKVKNAKGTEEDAQTAGRTVEEQFRASVKQRAEKPDPKMVEELSKMIQPTIPKRPNETDEAWQTRTEPEANRRAILMEDLSRNNPEEYKKQINTLGGTTGGSAIVTPTDVDTFAKSLRLGEKEQPAGAPAPPPKETRPPTIGTNFGGGGGIPQSSALPVTGTTTGLAALLPSGAPNYAAANDTEALSKQLNKIFGASFGSEEAEPSAATA